MYPARAAALLQCPSRDANQVAAMPGPDQFAAFDSIDFTSLFRLDGRKSVVVGGGSGLGRAGAGFRNPGDTAPGWDAHPQVAGACPPRPRRRCRRTNGVGRGWPPRLTAPVAACAHCSNGSACHHRPRTKCTWRLTQLLDDITFRQPPSPATRLKHRHLPTAATLMARSLNAHTERDQRQGTIGSCS
jgi:hypothetical protein